MLHHCAASAALSTAAFCLPHNYRDRCVSSVCAHLFYVCCPCLIAERGRKCVKKTQDMCSSRFTHSPTLHHSSTTKQSAGRDVWLVRVPLCWVDRRGTIASLCFFSVWPPSCCILARGSVGFWLCEPCWPGLCLLVTDPLCPQCLLLDRPLRAADYPTVIGAWALADQRCPADCRALVIFHSLVLCSTWACTSVFPAANLPRSRLWPRFNFR